MKNEKIKVILDANIILAKKKLREMIYFKENDLMIISNKWIFDSKYTEVFITETIFFELMRQLNDLKSEIEIDKKKYNQQVLKNIFLKIARTKTIIDNIKKVKVEKKKYISFWKDNILLNKNANKAKDYIILREFNELNINKEFIFITHNMSEFISLKNKDQAKNPLELMELVDPSGKALSLLKQKFWDEFYENEVTYYSSIFDEDNYSEYDLMMMHALSGLDATSISISDTKINIYKKARDTLVPHEQKDEIKDGDIYFLEILLTLECEFPNRENTNYYHKEKILKKYIWKDNKWIKFSTLPLN